MRYQFWWEYQSCPLLSPVAKTKALKRQSVHAMGDVQAHAHRVVRAHALEPVPNQAQAQGVRRVVQVVRQVVQLHARVLVLEAVAQDAHHYAEAVAHQIVPALV